jgi:uncharacterized membrane protein YhaH (DUF805 family)
VNFEAAIRDALSKYAQFNGRSSRSAYWWFVLFVLLVYVATESIDGVVNTPAFTALAVIGLFLPSLAVLVRRLHDTDRSGWWVLISFVPFIGGIVLIVFACIDSGPPNKYGDGPDNGDNLTVFSSGGGAFPPPPPPPSSTPPPPPTAPAPSPGEMPPPQASDRASD